MNPRSLVFRPVRESDLDAVVALSEGGGKTLTTLPQDRDFLSRRISRSMHAFYPEVVEPGNEAYTFVLEDTETGHVYGISGAYARTGGYEPFYTYERVQTRNHYGPLKIDQMVECLECRTWHKGPSELGSLYLEPAARGAGVGKLLSLGRLLFMDSFPQRFEERVIAEIRGWQNEQGRTPFWDACIEPFFGAEFEKMDAVSGVSDKDFIGALLPKHPIYCDLLDVSVRDVIGRPHSAAEPAMRLLEKLGFEQTNYVDVFDAGPMIEAELGSLTTSRATPVMPVSANAQTFTEEAGKPCGIIFQQQLDFRAYLCWSKPDAEGRIELNDTLFTKISATEAPYHFYPF